MLKTLKMRSLFLVLNLVLSVYGSGVVPVNTRPACMVDETCDMVCLFGYKTNISGCSICECLEDPCTDQRCAVGQKCEPKLCNSYPCSKLEMECVDETKIPCPMPMCFADCPDGYKKNKHGCMTCDCVDKKATFTCDDLTCPEGHRCTVYLPGCNTEENDCKMQPTCVPDDNRQAITLPCPAFDCSVVCSFGYRRNEQGCQTCQCNESPCDNHMCTKEEICQVREKTCSEPMCPLYASCTAKPLCTYSDDDLECDDSGAFIPKQCQSSLAEDGAKQQICWCVDDRGVEVDGSRAVVLKDESNLPDCERNITVKLNLTIKFSFGVDDIYKYMEQIKITVPKHISKWMMIENKYIRLEEVGVNHEVYTSFLMVRVTIVHDGQTDLASAAAYLMRKVERGECRIPLDEKNDLKTEPKHVHVDHTFQQQPQTFPTVGEVYTGEWKYSLLIKLLIPVGITTFLLLLLLIIFTTRRRCCNSANQQFKHRALQNQESFKRNLSYYADQMTLGDAEKEKQAVMDEAKVTLEYPLGKNDSEA